MSSCVPRDVPAKYTDVVCENAWKVNRRNKPDGVAEPQRIAVMTTKYFGPDQRVLTVSFMESVPRDVRNKILAMANRWECGITFAFTQGTGDVRISRGSGGYWSYLGTDIFSIPRNRQTMNLQGFTMRTPESEWLRVVPHEFGHTYGFPHEHNRKAIVDEILRQEAYSYFRRTSGWDRRTVDSQVLTPQEESSLISTRTDVTSIMCYHLPGQIMRSGEAVPGGKDINDLDRKFAQEIYPVETTEPDPEEPVDPIEPLPDGDIWDWNRDFEEIDWK